MNLLTSVEINNFLSLINPLPLYKVLELSFENSELSEALGAHLKDENGTVVSIEYEKGSLLNKPFRALPREYDVIIFNNIFLKHEYSQKILKIAYTALANAGNIIIIEDKNCDLEKIFSLLDECDFRAPNEIDIFSDKKIVVAKKMHMWGNGL